MRTCDVCCCWIAPDGKASHLGEVAGFGSHCGVAVELGDQSGGRELDEKGYMHVSYGGPYFGDPGRAPTQAQLDTLFDIQQELTKRKSAAADYIKRYLTAQAEKDTK
jgi:hypothetical protein